MTTVARRQRNRDQGSATMEVVLLVPALVIMLGLLVGGGRLWFARTTVDGAANGAARAASLARSAGEAVSEGMSAGRESLATDGLNCVNQVVSIDAGAFATPVGAPGTIRSTVTCAVPFGDVFLPGMPGSITLSSSGSSALDTYRSRR